MFTGTKTAALQKIYLDWINNFLTIGAFADHYEINETQANEILALGKAAHEGIVERHKSDDYSIKYMYMGGKMHNWQVFYKENRIGYALTDSEAWGICEEHHIDQLIGLV